MVDLISLKPFDMETISKSVKKTRKAIIVEECMKTGGIGASLSAVINESLFNELDHEIIRLSSQVRAGRGGRVVVDKKEGGRLLRVIGRDGTTSAAPLQHSPDLHT